MANGANYVEKYRLEQRLSGIHSKAQGEKACPVLMMFNALLLQSGYRLSDRALEKPLAKNDQSFNRLHSSVRLKGSLVY